MNPNLRVNKTNFHMKDFAPGLALKQRRNATWKSPIVTDEHEAGYERARLENPPLKNL